MIMGNTIVTGSLIVFSDGFVWKILSNEKAYKIWVSAENEDFELYKVRVDDESESLIESLEDLQDALNCEEWEEVDSCWGCYEETDELIKEVMIENGLEE